MDTKAVLAALNDEYGLNNNHVLDLIEDANSKRQLESVNIDIFTDYLNSQALQDENLTNVVEDIIACLNESDFEEYRTYIDELEKEGKHFFTVLDDAYPSSLKRIEKPPLGIYVDGDLSHHINGVALVGTRQATDQRKQFAEKIAKSVVEDGRAVISGLANGIDEVGHKSAINYGGKTISVLPGHINKISPKSNKDIGEEIPENGALVSGVSNNIPITRRRFVYRNRITSGLSELVVIGASRDSGGTIRQAEFAKAHEIPILLYTPPADDGQSPEKIKEMGAYTFSNIGEFKQLLSKSEELNPPDGGNKKLDDFNG